jgi:alpha-tubulin suppressor-like RCC1 family protein
VRELDRAVQVAFALVGKACWVGREGQLWCKGAVTGLAQGDSARPTTRLQFDAPVVEVALGGGFVCVRHPNGAVSCAGDVIFTGEQAPLRPRPVPGLADVTQLAAGAEHACALRKDGRVACWGSNRSGQLGTKNEPCPKRQAACELVAVSIDLLDEVAEIAAGDYFTCARERSGAVFCWGIDSMGELGASASETCDSVLFPVGKGPCSHTPLRVRDLDDAVHLATGSRHSCVVRANGRVSCWGSNLAGELGASASEQCPPSSRVGYPCSTRPVDVGLADVIDVAVAGIFNPIGGGYSCAETRTREVLCWGATGDLPPGVPGAPDGPHATPRKIGFSN